MRRLCHNPVMQNYKITLSVNESLLNHIWTSYECETLEMTSAN